MISNANKGAQQPKPNGPPVTYRQGAQHRFDRSLWFVEPSPHPPYHLITDPVGTASHGGIAYKTDNVRKGDVAQTRLATLTEIGGGGGYVHVPVDPFHSLNYKVRVADLLMGMEIQ